MALVRAFYCPPVLAEKKGYILTDTYDLSNSEAKKLRDLYDKLEAGQNYSISAALVVLGAAISGVAAVIGFGLGTLTAQTIVGEYMQSLDNDFDSIATNGKSCTKVKVTYTYKRHGSNDGAYFLSKVEVI